MSQSKKIIFGLIGLGVIIVGFISYKVTNACPTTREQKIVQGDSLHGLLNNGTKVTAQMGYYKCHQAKAGDIVLYHYGGDPNPLIKVVRAVPGDRLALQTTSAGIHILVNGNVLTTSSGTPFNLLASSARLLELYVNDYHGAIPNNSYLIMGNLVGGSTDSSQFGLISGADLLGKVEK